jgi:hypothetical protein
MNTLEAAGSVLDEDGKGGSRFDRMTVKNPIDILDFSLGYLSGPMITESAEEHEELPKRVVKVPEEACSTRIAL